MGLSWSRRSFLLASAGTAVGLSGCSAFDTNAGESEPFRLGSIEIRNFDTAHHRVHLFVERDAEVVYWNDSLVDGKQGNTAGGEVIAPESLVRTEGDYVIRVRLDKQTEVATFDAMAEDLTGCHVVQIRIRRYGSVEFSSSKGAYECDPEYTAPNDSLEVSSDGQ